MKKETPFKCTQETQKAFDLLKQKLCSAPVLIFPDLEKEFSLYTDSSGYAIGCCLCQGPKGKENPICYISRTLTANERKYSTYEKEFFAIYWSINHLRGYLYKHFTVYCDHRPLSFCEKSEKNTRVLKWRHEISDLDFTIIYLKGKTNLVADCLSRQIDMPQESNVVTRAQKSKQENSPIYNKNSTDKVWKTNNVAKTQ